VALGAGVLPVVGNAAYPAQLLYCSVETTGGLARFIVYDTFAAMGRAVPIWGGSDTLIEHAFNRLADRVVHWLAKPLPGLAAKDAGDRKPELSPVASETVRPADPTS
jgi:hypothetical protein